MYKVTRKEIDWSRTRVRGKTTAAWPRMPLRPLRLRHARVSSLWANLWTIIKWEISNFRNVQLASKTARSHRTRRLLSYPRNFTSSSPTFSVHNFCLYLHLARYFYQLPFICQMLCILDPIDRRRWKLRSCYTYNSFAFLLAPAQFLMQFNYLCWPSYPFDFVF